MTEREEILQRISGGIGLMNDSAEQEALELAEILLKVCRQWKVSVVFPDETVMLSAEDGQ
jgi:hypothetical protein